MENKKIKVISRSKNGCSLKMENGTFKRWPRRGFEVLMSKDEILNAANSNGGRRMLENHLMITDKDVLKEIGIEVEQEYFYNEKAVKALLLEGSLGDLEDALKISNEGIREMIKDIAVEIKLDDISKRNTISKYSGVNVNDVIRFTEELESADEDENNEDGNVKTKTRKNFANFQGKY